MNARLIALTLGAFAVVILALMAAGVVPLEALQALLRGSLGIPFQEGETFRPRAITMTLRETTPLLMAGVGVFLALRAGLFNIGVEGQFLVGALTAAVIALNVNGPLGIGLALVAGALAGALWALPAGLIKAYRGGHEVITTIMLNNIAIALTTGLAAGPLKDPRQQAPSTPLLDSGTKLPALYSHEQFSISSALLIALLILVAFVFWLRRTVAGYELSAAGANPTAATFAGVSVPKVTVRAMVASGAIGGVAGACQVLAFESRFYQGISPGYGFDALGVALLAGASPWGIIPSALLFGILNRGAASVSLLGVPKGITGILLGLLIIVFAAYRYRQSRQSHG